MSPSSETRTPTDDSSVVSLEELVRRYNNGSTAVNAPASAEIVRPRVYIAGPISGHADYNEPAFLTAGLLLESAGYEAVNPLDLNPLDHTVPRREFLKRDLPALLDCEAVYLLPGWRESIGCLHEVETAFLAEIPVYDRWPMETPLTPEALPPALAANLLVHGSRMRDYAHPSVNLERIAAGWRVIFGGDVSLRQVGLALAWLKIARDVATPKHDNLVDLAGYAEVAAMAVEP